MMHQKTGQKDTLELKTQSLKQSGVKKMIAVCNLWRENPKAEQVHQVIIPIPFEFFYVCHSFERGIQLFNRKISNLIGIKTSAIQLLIQTHQNQSHSF